MKFSQRIGKTDPELDLQVERADPALRTALWNVIWRHLVADDSPGTPPDLNASYFDEIWEFFFKRPTDEQPPALEAAAYLKKWVQECDWYRLYDLLEFFWTILPPSETRVYEVDVNRALERERSAYRMVQAAIVPVSDALEVEEITGAVRRAEEHGIEAAQTHLARALKELAVRDEPDYDGAVLQAVRALREVARFITRDTDAGLVEALDEVDPHNMLPQRFRVGLVNLFEEGDALDERHLFREAEVPVGMPEARYYVVSVSAVINYLLALTGPKALTSRSGARKKLGGRRSPSLGPGKEE